MKTKNICKRIASLAMALVMVLGMLPTFLLTARAEEGEKTLPKAIDNLVYNGKAQALITPGTAEDGYYWIYYSFDSQAEPLVAFMAASKEIPTQTDVDVWKIAVFYVPSNWEELDFPEQQNYVKENQTYYLSATIRPAIEQAPVVKTGLTYTGEAQDVLAFAGTISGGSNKNMQYSVTSKSATSPGDSTETPTVTDAGDYKLWYCACDQGARL